MSRDHSTVFYILGGLAFLALASGGFVAVKRALSDRNNNPGNIEKGTAWKGLDTQATAASPRFAVFLAPKWGFRAMARILLGDWREGQDTIRSLISEWSPLTDVFRGTAKPQNTSAYIAAVAKALKVLPDTKIDVPARLPEILTAIAKHEAGYWPTHWTAADVIEGIRLEKAA